VVQDGHEYYSSQPCYNYMIKMSELCQESTPLEFLFQKFHPDIVAVIKNMLNLDPTKRQSAKELLSNKIFDKVRNPGQEI
jgi:hypothetical protein